MSQRSTALGLRGVGPDGRRRDTGIAEDSRHEACVVNADAKAERPHPGEVIYALLELLENETGPGVVRGEDVRQAFGVVPAAAPPGDVTQVRVVVNAVVDKGREALLIDRIPKAQL